MKGNECGFCATIGFFDGVHRGHKQVMNRLKSIANGNGQQTMVVTFGNHPLEVVRPGFEPPLLITIAEKVERIKECGIDEVVVLTFTKEMMQQPAYEFMEKTLRDKLGVRTLLIGYDNRFGKRNTDETFMSYKSYGEELGIEVIEGPKPEECGLFEGKPISSSLIRQLKEEGRLNDVREFIF